jgi:flagellar hook capping protein FlgD
MSKSAARCQHALRCRAFVIAGLLGLVGTGAGADPAVETLSFTNGLIATVYSAEYLRQHVVQVDGGPAIRLDDGRLIPVVMDVADPSIPNKGDGAFHPFSSAAVAIALRAVEHPSIPMSIRVYLLPYPRQGLLTSSTTGLELFLSPHVLEIDPSTAAYIVAHELGHVFHNRFMPENGAEWNEYRQIRGITDSLRFSESSSHAFRPKEIFAESFFVRVSGGVVAHALRGDARRIAVTGVPNPFNPRTELRISVPAELARQNLHVRIRVYSVTGALVRDLYDGRAGGDFSVSWDGTDGRGNRVASATYYAAVETPGSKETVKLVLLE